MNLDQPQCDVGGPAFVGRPGAGPAAVERKGGTARSERLVVKRGTTRVVAGAGNDTILAADGRREAIDCGNGRDTVTADRSDSLVHCEVVRYAKRVPARGR